MGFYIHCLNEDYRLPEALSGTLKRHLENLLEEYDLFGGEAGLILVDDQFIRTLNKKYRDRDAPTDVLSFSYLEPEEVGGAREQEFAVGDIYVSVDRARAQALEVGHSLEKEIALLAVHGLLHLLGFDHEQEDEKEIMRNKELEILEQLDL